jgi:hypothetical protein
LFGRQPSPLHALLDSFGDFVTSPDTLSLVENHDVLNWRALLRIQEIPKGEIVNILDWSTQIVPNLAPVPSVMGSVQSQCGV